MVAWLLLPTRDGEAMPSIGRRCPAEAATDVTARGPRRADRYSVPLVTPDPGGMAGVKATVGARGARVATPRPAAR